MAERVAQSTVFVKLFSWWVCAELHCKTYFLLQIIVKKSLKATTLRHPSYQGEQVLGL